MVFPAQIADSDLQTRVAAYLNDRTAPKGCQLRVEAHGGTIVLQGSVPSLYEKELCRHVCTRVAGVLHVIDETVVGEAKAAKQVPQLQSSRVPR